MIRKFEILVSCHSQYCIQLHDASEYEHWFLRRAVCDSHMDSEFYIRKQESNPFLQGGYDSYSGWILVEFWQSDINKVRAYVDWLNSAYDQTVKQAERFGILENGKYAMVRR